LFAWHVQAEPILVPVQLICAMFGMGCTLGLGDFALVLRYPRALLLGLAFQLVLVPLVALAFAHGFGLSKGWAVGLMLVSVVPGGAFSNLLTFIGRGSVPLSIALTTVSTLGAVVTVPLWLDLMASAFLPGGFVFPTERAMTEIVLYLLLPLGAGMLLRRWHRGRADALAPWAIRASLLAVIVIATGALGSGRIRVIEYGWQPPLLILAFGVALVTLTPQLCRVFGRYDDETVALSVEVAVRNIGIALLLVQFFFPGDAAQSHVLYTCLFYAGAQLGLALPIVLRHRVGRGSAMFWPARPRPAEPQLP
jgi:BASS family bile acid:Na+ symporter